MIDAVIVDVAVIAGHDGQAELALRLHHGDGNCSDVVLDALAVSALINVCGADEVRDLIGESWTRIAELSNVRRPRR